MTFVEGNGCGGAIATFDYGVWRAQYPEFDQTVNACQAEGYWYAATRFLDNNGGSPVPNTATGTKRQQWLLNLLTAHVAQLFAAPAPNEEPSQLVGRISSATQGSVSVSTDMPSNPNAAWYNQTKYGAMYWQAMAPSRTAHYFPAPQRIFTPWGPG